jgi:hypothetical protein
LPNADPFEDIHVLLENWIRFVRESGCDDFVNAGCPRCVRDQPRVDAVAGNYSQSVWFPHDRSLPKRPEQKSFNT